VLAQDTGFTTSYPTGEGLLAYATLEEAAAAVQAVAGDYRRHSLVARSLAEQHFDSKKVLSRLLDVLGVA
jgi:hypothetical protein